MRDADVIVVGAGFAGIAATRRLVDMGLRVALVEARDRVGGRVLTEDVDGVAIDLGGQWLGPQQTRAMELVAHHGLRTFPQHVTGANVLDFDGRRRLFQGTVPRVDPISLASVGWAWWRLDQLSKQVPLERPWEAPRAEAWDALTLETFVQRNAPTRTARKLLRYAFETVFAADCKDVSLLHAAFYVRSGGNLDGLLSSEGGAQQDRLVTGMQRFAEALATPIESSLRLSTPVRAIDRGTDGVTIRTDGGPMTASRVIVALPPMLAGRLGYEPAMPGARDQLTQRVPQGAVIKCFAIYDEPFWRREGLSGHALTDVGPAHVLFDATPESGAPGVLLGFVEGKAAHAWMDRATAERERAVLACFARAFGDRALRPLRYLDKCWAEDPWARGCYAGYFPPGVWTSSGPHLRAPIGPVHWAGTETATQWNGYVEGAIRSGERAADEVLAAMR